MRERRDRFRLALEAGQRVGIGRDGLREDLDRHVPVQLLIPRAVDLPHPPRAQRREDLVGAEAGPRWEGQCVVRLYEPCRQGPGGVWVGASYYGQARNSDEIRRTQQSGR